MLKTNFANNISQQHHLTPAQIPGNMTCFSILREKFQKQPIFPHLVFLILAHLEKIDLILWPFTNNGNIVGDWVRVLLRFCR